MGTKRGVVHRVVPLLCSSRRDGAVMDLFSGMGSVATAMADKRHVITNDVLSFTGAFARARFLPSRRMPVSAVVLKLRPTYRDQVGWLRSKFRDQLHAEQISMDGDARAMAKYMAAFEHAANSEHVKAKARRANLMNDHRRYQLASLYYAGGYFSLRQANQIDAIRYAIDTLRLDVDRDWLVAAWLSATANTLNGPGHTAQYLKPSSEDAALRIRQYWRRDIWELFQDRLSDLMLVGSESWRAANRVYIADALELVARPMPADLKTVYADPPYTRDQYSRYYHVYETLYQYDYPSIQGIGRTPSDRFDTAFSRKSKVVSAFRQLLGSLRKWSVRVVISYPSDGLLTKAGASVAAIAEEQGFKIVSATSFGKEHSTLGASGGFTTKDATENLYVCR
jgi:adenine-specific DNA-methyltransferase